MHHIVHPFYFWKLIVIQSEAKNLVYNHALCSRDPSSLFGRLDDK